MTEEKTHLLDEAVARNCGIVLSYPSDGMLRHHKSRFLGECSDGIWVESPPQEAKLADALIAAAKPAGFSFKNGANKVVFTAVLLKREPEHRVNEEVSVEAVLLQRPKEIKAVQRRAAYRVRVPQDYEMTVRLWRIGREADLRDKPMSASEIPCKLIDLSVGGIGLLLENREGKSVAIHPADRLRLELTHLGESLVVEGRLRYPEQKPRNDACRAGIQFCALEDAMQGRRVLQALTRITGELQRLELRRFRLGVT
jgi:c-di-GMP-binding flagellar brake protein YcgR